MWEASFVGTAITVTSPPVGFVPKLLSPCFHRPCCSSNSPLRTWPSYAAGKVFRFDRSAIWCNPSKSVNTILGNFPPSNPITLRMIPNSRTGLLSSFNTSTPKTVRAKVARTLVLANLDSWVRPWRWWWWRFRRRCRVAKSVPLVGSPILRGWIFLLWSKVGMSLYTSKRSSQQNAWVGSLITKNWWSSRWVPSRGLGCLGLWNLV